MGRLHPRFVALRASAATGIVVAIAALLVPAVPLTGGPSPPHPIDLLGTGPCAGARVASTYNGTLGVLGGPSPGPSVAAQAIQADFDYETITTRNGSVTNTACSADTATASTGTSGAFSINLTLPTASPCGGGTCVSYGGPYAPASFGTANAPPGGYFVRSIVTGTTLALDFVAALDTVTLAPYGRTTVSVGAPVTLTATPLAGDGAPSPSTVTFAWVVAAGPGWTVTGGEGTDALTVETPAIGAGVATVEVYVNGTFNGTTQHAAPQTADLTAVPTEVVASSVDRTALDVGATATFSVVGTGSGGYAYTATVYPGLGAPSQNGSCTSTAQNGGLLALSCSVPVVYTTTGTASPSATLSNGWSAASATFAPITVAPGLAVDVTPSPVRTYAAKPTAVELSVATGTGTAPFGPACVWPGYSTVLCDPAGGPVFDFTADWPAVGNYTATYSVVDDGGVNRTGSFAVDVAPVPKVGELVGPGKVDVGAPVVLASEYFGGALPAEYWWNDSLPASTLAVGALPVDGPLNLTYAPTALGDHTVTLTVVDALGTVETTYVALVVAPGTPRSLDLVNAPPAVLTAGHATTFAWAAANGVGEVVTDYAGATVSLTPVAFPSGATLSVEDVGGVVLPAAGGAFDLPSTGWRSGYLNVTFRATVAGTYTLAVAAPLPVAGTEGGDLGLVVVADNASALLSDPRTVDAGPAANHTLWRIADAFGNPYRSGSITVVAQFGGNTSSAPSPVRWNASASWVWVNFTIPAGVGGTVWVLSGWNASIALLSVSFAAPATASPWVLAAVAAFAGVAIACLAAGVRGRRVRPPPATPEAPPDDAEWKRLAAGRAHVLGRADPIQPRSLGELLQGWNDRMPDPAELADWVGALVVEGLLRASVGPDGTPRFTKVVGPPQPPGEGTPTVVLDPAALDAALAHRPTPDEDRPPDGDAAERGDR